LRTLPFPEIIMATVRKRTWTYKGETRSAWVVTYTDQGGKRRLKTFKTKRSADDWLVDAAHEVKRGTHTADSASITVGDACDLWIGTGEREGLERSTLNQYRQHARLHIKPAIGATKLSRLTAPAVQGFADELVGKLSRPMAHKVLCSLRMLLSEAVRQGKVAQNVAREIKIKQVKRSRRRVTIPSKDEMRALLAAAAGRWRPLIVTATFTGLRASELRGLLWPNVDLEAATIHVRQRADAWNEIGSPKTEAGTRDVMLPPIVVNTLRDWQRDCPKGELGLVFPNGDGNVESLANIYNRGWGPLQCKVGIVRPSTTPEGGEAIQRPQYGLHALRHFYASWLIDQGFQPKRIQELMGHASLQITMDTYGHLFPTTDDDRAKLAAGAVALVA
jgi:integrase